MVTVIKSEVNEGSLQGVSVDTFGTHGEAERFVREKLQEWHDDGDDGDVNTDGDGAVNGAWASTEDGRFQACWDIVAMPETASARPPKPPEDNPRGRFTQRQTRLMTKLRSAIARVGETCGEGSSIHTDLREFAHDLDWYFTDRVLEEVR